MSLIWFCCNLIFTLPCGRFNSFIKDLSIYLLLLYFWLFFPVPLPFYHWYLVQFHSHMKKTQFQIIFCHFNGFIHKFIVGRCTLLFPVRKYVMPPSMKWDKISRTMLHCNSDFDVALSIVTKAWVSSLYFLLNMWYCRFYDFCIFMTPFHSC